MKKMSFKMYTLVTQYNKKYVIWWNRIRLNAWKTIKRKWFNIPEAFVLPFYVKIFRFILFPIDAITGTIYNNLSPYNWSSDSWTIDKMEFSDSIFQDIGNMFALKPGKSIQLILKKDKNNCVVVERIVYYNEANK